MSNFTNQFDFNAGEWDKIFWETMKQQDEAAKALFNIKEGKNIFLPLLGRHYWMINGEISDIEKSKRQSADSEDFSGLLNVLVRNIILEFGSIRILNQIEDSAELQSENLGNFNELSDERNFLFYILKGELKYGQKYLKVLLSISGSSLYGKEWCKELRRVCEDKLMAAIKRIKDSDYIIEGIFIPFSERKKEVTTKEHDYAFDQLRQFLTIMNDSCIENTFITKFLQGGMNNEHITSDTLSENHEFHGVLACLKEAYERSKQTKATIERIRGFGNSEELMESITLDFLEGIEEERSTGITRWDETEYSFKLSKIRKNFEFLRDLSLYLHLEGCRERVEELEDEEEFDNVVAMYEESLKKVWEHFKRSKISDWRKYQTQCSEDHLIHYLTINSHILKEEGMHYIFSMRNSIKKGYGKALRVRVPCSYCIIHFPLEFTAIAEHKARLPHFIFEERLKLDELSMDEKKAFLRDSNFKVCPATIDKKYDPFQNKLELEDPPSWRKIPHSSFNQNRESNFNDQSVRRKAQLTLQGVGITDFALYRTAKRRTEDIFHVFTRIRGNLESTNQVIISKLRSIADQISSLEMGNYTWMAPKNREIILTKLREKVSSVLQRACEREDYKIICFLKSNVFLEEWCYLLRDDIKSISVDIGNATRLFIVLLFLLVFLEIYHMAPKIERDSACDRAMLTMRNPLRDTLTAKSCSFGPGAVRRALSV